MDLIARWPKRRIEIAIGARLIEVQRRDTEQIGWDF